MSEVAAPPIVKFHLSLNVASLDRSVAFFQTLFGREAAKCRPDYAKFELDEPPVVLSLEPSAPTSSGALNHLGFRLSDSSELVEWQRRLEAAGIATQREEGVKCCYARQTKFWVRDPDNNLWEIYVLDEDIDHRGIGQVPEALPEVQVHQQPPIAAAKAIWQHQLGTSLPEKILAHNASTDEVRLRGSFNAPHATEDRQRFLIEVFRVLAPGGTVLLHMLTGGKTLTMPPGTLPGPAAFVTHVPAIEELLNDLKTTGFEEAELTKYGSRPCFKHGATEVRETMIVARKPATEDCDGTSEVVYRGPLAAVCDDQGNQYVRGQRIAISAARWAAISKGPLAKSFTCFEASSTSGCMAK